MFNSSSSLPPSFQLVAAVALFLVLALAPPTNAALPSCGKVNPPSFNASSSKLLTFTSTERGDSYFQTADGVEALWIQGPGRDNVWFRSGQQEPTQIPPELVRTMFDGFSASFAHGQTDPDGVSRVNVAYKPDTTTGTNNSIVHSFTGKGGLKWTLSLQNPFASVRLLPYVELEAGVGTISSNGRIYAHVWELYSEYGVADPKYAWQQFITVVDANTAQTIWQQAFPIQPYKPETGSLVSTRPMEARLSENGDTLLLTYSSYPTRVNYVFDLKGRKLRTAPFPSPAITSLIKSSVWDGVLDFYFGNTTAPAVLSFSHWDGNVYSPAWTYQLPRPCGYSSSPFQVAKNGGKFISILCNNSPQSFPPHLPGSLPTIFTVDFSTGKQLAMTTFDVPSYNDTTYVTDDFRHNLSGGMISLALTSYTNLCTCKPSLFVWNALDLSPVLTIDDAFGGLPCGPAFTRMYSNLKLTTNRAGKTTLYLAHTREIYSVALN